MAAVPYTQATSCPPLPGSEALASLIYHLPPHLVTSTFLPAHFLAPPLLAVLTPEKVTRQEAHLGEHGDHAAQALLALLLQMLLPVRQGLQTEIPQTVSVLQEDVEVLGLVGSPRFSQGLYVVDHFLSGERRSHSVGEGPLFPPRSVNQT